MVCYDYFKFILRLSFPTEKNRTLAILLILSKFLSFDSYLYFWPGICINSDTSSEPPISRKGQPFAINSVASIESASMIVKPDINVVPPVVVVPSEFTVLVFLSGLAGLTAELPNEENQALYFDICCLPSSGLDGLSPPR